MSLDTNTGGADKPTDEQRLTGLFSKLALGNDTPPPQPAGASATEDVGTSSAKDSDTDDSADSDGGMKKKKFGKFECTRCKHKWTSVHSWKNMWQTCLACSTEDDPVWVVPYNTIERELKTGASSSHGGRPHQRSKCEMCRKLGRSCTKVSAVPKGKKDINRLADTT